MIESGGISLDDLLEGIKASGLRSNAQGIAIVRGAGGGGGGAWALHLIADGELTGDRFAYGASPADVYQRACAQVRDRLKANANRAREAADKAAGELARMIPKVPS